MVEDVVNLLGCEAGVDRHRHRISQRHGELSEQSLVAISSENAHAVALGHLVGDQRVGEGLGVFVELCEGDAPWPVDCGDFVGVNLCGALEEAQGCQGSVQAMLRCESHDRDCNPDH